LICDMSRLSASAIWRRVMPSARMARICFSSAFMFVYLRFSMMYQKLISPVVVWISTGQGPLVRGTLTSPVRLRALKV